MPSASIDGMPPFKKVVVATDFSESAEDALNAGLEIARDTGGQLLLVNVVLNPLHQSWTTDTVGIDFDELQRTWVDAAKAQFQALTRHHRLDERGGTATIVVGRPAAEIVRFAREQEANLIVMGTHGYGGVKRLLLGSVADQVIRHAACPVLVVPHRSLRPEGTREIGALVSSAGGSHDR